MSADFSSGPSPDDEDMPVVSPQNRWPGIPDDEALEWCRVFNRHPPSPYRPWLMGQLQQATNRGQLPVVDEWVTTADAARSDGFTPTLYQELFDSLKSIKRWAYRSHPKNRMITAGNCNPAVPFESVLWEDWPRLVRDEGCSPHEATEIILLLAEPKFPPRR